MRGFYEIAAEDPERPALLGDEGMTYGALLDRANQAAGGLTSRGVRPGDCVVTVLKNGADALVMMLATYQIGVYLVPVNWHFTAEEIAYIVADCGAEVVIAPDALTVAELVAGQPATAPGHRRAGSMMLYTSGTTGRPKGVRRRLLDLTPEELYPILMRKSWRHFGLPMGGVHLVCSQLYHSAPYGQAMMALQFGHSIVAPERFEAAAALELIQRYRVTNAFMVPTMFHRLLAVPDRESYDLSSLTHLYHGAAPCPPATKQAMIDWLGPVVWEYYGSTEAAVATMVSAREWLERPGTVGRALDGMSFTIIGDDGEEAAPGQPGLVYIGGINRFEYHRDPDKTASAMRGREYTPGDIGYLDDDGYLFLLDRRTDLIISGGVNIYPAEIEAALLEHPSVADVAVIGVPDPEWGHKVVALVQPADGIAGGEELTAELLRHCAPRLARLKHPRLIEYRQTLPRTPTGKLSRRNVREAYLSS
ncbi:long-chain acyl-CoA synthetase [Nonomuraea fuscirosea]|uniref:Long-chain acyl-CoA synthetase n=1 Tax=Nonomuraea fuscirosea TaxID=1291556 RepID=A0A2T0N7J6_9ACTN|nr:AMP-binding protein [Nonomuraea fuscirosea]PRX68490.1 long-chain acyl-CoA synthetase [Nonomuraea fuscirosea]